MINRKKFFARVRKSVFGGRLRQSQVDGTNSILDVWEERRPFPELPKLAYCLATSAWETAWTMLPVEEIGRGRGREYGKPHPTTGQRYYGRGLPQLTWYRNYLRAGREIGVDLVNNPDLMLKPEISARVLFIGMRDGWFTGHDLGDHINEHKTDFVGARRIVNGTDRAHEIAAIAKNFLSAINASWSPDPVPQPVRRPWWRRLLDWLFGVPGHVHA